MEPQPYAREVMQRLCAELYDTWQWNMASEEREQDGTSAGWDENDYDYVEMWS